MPDLKVEVRNDGSIEFFISGGDRVVVNSQQLSAFISGLMKLRAGMQPPLASPDPQQSDTFIIDERGRWALVPCKDPAAGLNLLVSHPGLGWLQAPVSAADAQQIAHTIPLMLMPKNPGMKQ